MRLFYKDGIHVDIAPVFEWNAGGYILPSGDGGWIRTNPDTQEAWLKQEDARLNNHLLPMIRLIKKWNAEHGKQLKSFHLTVLAVNTFESLGSRRPEAIALFFDWAARNLAVNDPAGHSGNLASHLTILSELNLTNRLTNASGRARKALEAEKLGDHEEAIRLWRIEFGSGFPAYG